MNDQNDAHLVDEPTQYKRARLYSVPSAFQAILILCNCSPIRVIARESLHQALQNKEHGTGRTQTSVQTEDRASNAFCL